MADKRFLVKFKTPRLSTQEMIAATMETHGDHFVLLNSQGRLVALFLSEIIEGWTVSEL